MGRRVIFVALAVLALAFGFGVKFGYSAGLHHEAKSQVVMVPKVIIQHDKPDSVTLTVTEPLPDSCVQLENSLSLIQANNVIIDRTVGIVNAQLVELGTLTALPGITRINTVTDKIIKARDQMDTAHVHNIELWSKVTFLKTECEDK